MEPLEPADPLTLGPYRLVARLGAGGMGRVYLARSGGGRTVAIKVVRAELAGDTAFRRRFAREAATARRVGGRCTAPVVDADPDAATPWLATEYVLGPPLDEAVARFGPLPEQSLRALGVGLAEALTDIHAAGLVHRDLKPSNVLMAVDGPKVIDFGIARALDEERLTSTGLVIGSPGFMSPEQASGAEVTPASDVFALGSVLVFAATGVLPFGDGPSAVQLYNVVHEPPELTGVPESLLPVIRACLTKDPAKRPQPASLAGEGGLAALLGESGGWLPGPLASSIASHAASIMDMDAPDAPDHFPQPVAATVREGGAGGAGGAAGAGSAGGAGTSGPGASGAGTTQVGGGPSGPGRPSRRKLLAAAIGGGAVVAGGAAWGITALVGGSGSPSTGPTRAPGQAPDADWRTTVPPASSAGRPVVSGGTVLLPVDPTAAPSSGAAVVAVDAASHRTLWKKPGSAISGQPVVGGGKTVLLRDGAQLRGYDARGGQQRLDDRPGAPWQVLAADATAAYLVVRAAGGAWSLTAVDLSTRRPRWTKPLPAGGAPGTGAAAALDGGSLVYASGTGYLTCRATADGGEAWHASGKLTSPAPMPVIADGTVYVRDGSNDPDSGTARLLRFPLRGPGTPTPLATAGDGDGGVSAPAATGGAVFVVAGRSLVAYDTASHQQKWSVDLVYGIDGQATVLAGSGTVYVAETGSLGIQAFDASSSKQLWTFRSGDASTASQNWTATLSGGRLYAVLGTALYRIPAK
ncbi:hypothetical protein BIV57_07940 [Mangrovactinospora gilvigrisea]|uniref:Protein kinase domain-containing protein n=1 Tax=Mangrovactinospora gilvigrisea TaxID=1428644 RepID=A0A1J7BHH6_9ACTN|nr:serine/threonine-protein kinase [Mangrovactinospora gilvigrisea]OIV38037.1 hypothetical protein BIV57_07940 [Mangrovactinospora gilvigrisea]